RRLPATVRAEPALSAALRGGLAAQGPVLDALPTALLLIEPGTDDVLHANAAAHRLAGGAFPLGRLEIAVAPAVARGETVANVQVDWRERCLMVSGATITLPE